MTRRFTATLFAGMGLSLMPFMANGTEPDSTATIIDHIQASGIITVVQPEGMLKRLQGGGAVGERQVLNMGDTGAPATVESSSETESTDAVSGTTKVAGYRVQVFSDNNARSAKSEARSKAQAISEETKLRTYVVYQSPFWRLKVGDFTTKAEADNAADLIKKKFPSFAREVRVVRDRINR